MPALRVVEPTRVCARCKVRKPWSAFTPRTRWEDGSPRTVIAYCRPCANAKRKACYERHPGSKAEACRRYRERLQTDPERWEEYQDKQRFYARVWALRHGGNVGKFTRLPDEHVDAAPFVAWLRTIGSSSTEIARRTGLNARSIRAWLNGERSEVSIGTVDRACLHADFDLNDIYPLEDAA